MIPRSRPILYAYAIIAFCNVVLGGAALANFIDPAWIGLLNLIVGGASAALAVLQSGSNVESANVAVAMSGTTAVAGAASPIDTGTVLKPDETVAEVTPPPEPNK